MKVSNWRRTLQTALAEERAIAIPGEFERVFRAYHGLVFRTAYRITGNVADAEDISLTIHPHPTLSETVAFAGELAAGTITDLMPKRPARR